MIPCFPGCMTFLFTVCNLNKEQQKVAITKLSSPKSNYNSSIIDQKIKKQQGIKMDEICRLCLADTTNYDDYTSYFERMQLLMPEIDLNITPTFILCEDCSNNLNSAYTFKEKCLQIEERIKNYVSETQKPLTNLRCLKDQNYNNKNKLFEEVDVEVEYDNDFNEDRFTNSTKLDDFKDINSIKEEYNLTFPKVEIFRQEEIVENESLKAVVCEICVGSFKNPIELDRHRIVHSKINQLQDDYSEKDPLISPNREIFKCHIAEYATNQCVNEESELFMCEICKESFKELIELDQHRRIIHFKSDSYNKGTIYNLTFPEVEIFQQEEIVESESLKAFVCEVCMESFNNLIELDQHRIIAHSKINRLQDDYSETDPLMFIQCIKEDSELFVCQICKESFNESIELDQHNRIIHFKSDSYNKTIHSNEKIRHFCDICNKSFKAKQKLDSHKRVHNNKMHTCSICSKSYRYLQSHIRTVHMKKHVCKFCGMKFGMKYRLLNHMRRHTGDRPYACKVCGKGFMENRELNLHMYIHQTEKPYMCNICQKGFIYKVSLKRHMLHHVPNPEKPFVCEIITCSRRFKTRIGLRNHMRLHRLKKIHQCHMCDKRFSMSAHLRTHLKSHTGERPYECGTCHRRFTEKTNLARHLKIHVPKKI